MAFQFEPFNYGQVSVGGTATLIKAANSARQSMVVINHSTTDVFVGDASVTTTTGALLPGTKGAALTLPTTGAVYGITSGAAETVSFFEVQK